VKHLADYPNPACPLCGSLNAKTKQSFTSRLIIDEWQRTFQVDVSRDFDGVSQFELLECDACRLQFFVPFSLAGPPSLYAQLEKFDWYYMSEKWEHGVAMQDLEGCRNGLEVGCGFGDFVARVKKEKPGIAFEGCEQNPSAVGNAQARGLPVHLKKSEELAESNPGQYAAVCSFQVLEHVPDPGSFLKAACRLLSPGGKLILGLPNAQSFLGYQFNILDLPPHHMSRWTAETLRQMESQFPLKVRRIAYEPLAEYHVEGYVDVYANMFSRVLRGFSLHPGIRSRVVRLLRIAGLRRFLRGQSIYVCYERI
jgi:SAM-dependent methyltransferase